MGQAKRRREEIERLKREGAGPVGRDRKLLERGKDLIEPKLESMAAIARTLYGYFETAKVDGSIDRAMSFFYSTANKALDSVKDVPVACKKGCSHCCNVWVSVTAPEALNIAKIVRARGEAAMSKVRSAHAQTKAYDFHIRDQHPYPCPMLDQDACSIYDARPSSCRWAASGDAAICKRSYWNETDEGIPTPLIYLMGRNTFSLAMYAALRKSGLIADAYEFNAALTRALEIDDAESRWLAGQDVFAGVLPQPRERDDETLMSIAYKKAFG